MKKNFGVKNWIYYLISCLCRTIDVQLDGESGILQRDVAKSIIGEDLVDPPQTASPFLDEAHIVKNMCEYQFNVA